MKRLLLAAALCLAPSLGWAQCTGVFPANTLCGNLSATAQPPRAFSAGGTVIGPGSSLFHGLPIWGNSAGTLLADGTGNSIPGNYTWISASSFTGPISFTGNTQLSGAASIISSTNITISGTVGGAISQTAVLSATGPAAFLGSLRSKNFNSIRFVALYPGADWCAKLVNALAEVSTTAATLVVDNSAISTACTASSPISMTANHALYFVDGGEYTLNQQLQVGTDDRVEGIAGGNPFVSPFISGTRLKWTGATNTAMVKIQNAGHSRIASMGFDCNTTAGCVGIHMDSNNNPSTTNNTLENLALVNFNKGIVVGLSTSSAVSPASCAGNLAQSGCSQNDTFHMENIHMVGNCADATAQGFVINSQNAAQLSMIKRFGVQCVNIGVNIINMNGNFRLNGGSMGSVVGSNSVNIKLGSGVQVGPTITGMESEAGVYAISSQAGGQMFWGYNQFNQPSVVSSAAATVVSVSNIWTGLQISGTTWTSIGDVITGLSLGSNFIYRTVGSEIFTVATLPTCSAPRRGQSYTVTDANATTFNNVVAGGGANTLRVGCDGTNWRIGN